MAAVCDRLSIGERMRPRVLASAHRGREVRVELTLRSWHAASFVIRHLSFVIHGTFCSFPEHHQWNTCERTELTGSAT
ncbi:MAG: hypothetical protein DMF32_07555 [Verrucomicrobia bacterium]|nr:MAG: hypothetical protein DMF32_07555 [Verrucomicrobiota bacterium]